MSPTVFAVDSLQSLDEAERSIVQMKEKAVIRITGCNPPSDAQQLMNAATLLRAKNHRSKRRVKIEGFEVLQGILDRAAELADAKAQLEETASETPDQPPDQEHRLGYQHNPMTYDRNRWCIKNMDADAMEALDEEVVGNTKRYEHHRAMEEDATLVAREDWLPRVSEEYAKYRPSGSGPGPWI